MPKSILLILSILFISLLTGCGTGSPRESPWEPVPTELAATLQAYNATPPVTVPPAPKSTIAPATSTFAPNTPVAARLDVPFQLKIGQTALVQDSPDGFGILFHSLAEDSRCPKGVSCFWAGQVRLLVEPVLHGNLLSPLLELATARPEQMQADYNPYRIQLVKVEPAPPPPDSRIAPEDYTVTFNIVGISVDMTKPTPTPPIAAPYLSCPNLTRADASEILGEPVKERPMGTYLFRLPIQSLEPLACGYSSVAFTPGAASKDFGVFPSSIQSDHAVIADKFTDNRRLEQLLEVAAVIDAANPKNSTHLYDKLLTYYAAGAWSDNMLDDFVATAKGGTSIRLEPVANLNASATWVWREYAGGRYAALVAPRGNTLYVVAALTAPTRTEDSLRETMTGVLKQMLQ